MNPINWDILRLREEMYQTHTFRVVCICFLCVDLYSYFYVYFVTCNQLLNIKKERELKVNNQNNFGIETKKVNMKIRLRQK